MKKLPIREQSNRNDRGVFGASVALSLAPHCSGFLNIIAHIRAIVNFETRNYHTNCMEVTVRMIVYDRLWATMKEKNISQYKLIKEYKFSSGQLDRLRKNENVNTYTLNQLCAILDCTLDEIAEYIPEQTE